MRNIDVTDTDSIVLWRGNPDVYRFFVSAHAISKEEHLNWYYNRYLFDENRYDWMALDNLGQPIGVFGISREHEDCDTAEISYILAPQSRGVGYATEAITALLDFLTRTWNVRFVIAEIHEENEPSKQLAQRLGMELFSKDRFFCIYRTELNSVRDKTVCFRVDGNSVIGIGHIMRCLAIAEQIRIMGGNAVFVLADDSAASIIANRGFEVFCLNSKWNELNGEISSFRMMLREKNICTVLVDSYYVTDEYLKAIRENASVCYIDDFNNLEYRVDVMINYNIYGDEVGYLRKKYKQMYIGPFFAPLRSEFMNKKERVYKGIEKILISTGGTDEYNVVGNILDSFSKRSDFLEKDFYCILGRFNMNVTELKEKHAGNSNVHFLVDINNISHYMDMCDVAITAGGSTCYELCACGLPAILYTLADNQKSIAYTFEKRKIIPWIGDVRVEMGKCISNLFDELSILNNKECWEERSKEMQKLVDGRGAVRLAEALMGEI